MKGPPLEVNKKSVVVLQKIHLLLSKKSLLSRYFPVYIYILLLHLYEGLQSADEESISALM